MKHFDDLLRFLGRCVVVFCWVGVPALVWSNVSRAAGVPWWRVALIVAGTVLICTGVACLFWSNREDYDEIQDFCERDDAA